MRRCPKAADALGWSNFLPLFYDHLETLFDYVGDKALIGLDHLAVEARDERMSMILDAHDARSEASKVRGGSIYRPLPVETLYLPTEEWDGRMADHAERRFTPFLRESGDAVIDLGAKIGRNFTTERAQDSVNLFEAVADHAKALGKAGKRVLFASWSDGSSERLGTMLADHGLGKGAPRQRLGRRSEFRRGGDQGQAAPSARCCRWRMGSRPPISPSSPKPTSSATGCPDRAASVGRRTSWLRPLRSQPATSSSTSTTASGATRGLKTLDVAGARPRLPGYPVRRRGAALPAGGEHRPPHPLRLRE